MKLLGVIVFITKLTRTEAEIWQSYQFVPFTARSTDGHESFYHRWDAVQPIFVASRRMTKYRWQNLLKEEAKAHRQQIDEKSAVGFQFWTIFCRDTAKILSERCSRQKINWCNISRSKQPSSFYLAFVLFTSVVSSLWSVPPLCSRPINGGGCQPHSQSGGVSRRYQQILCHRPPRREDCFQASSMAAYNEILKAAECSRFSWMESSSMPLK